MTAVMLKTSPAATPAVHAVLASPGARERLAVVTIRSHVPGTTSIRLVSATVCMLSSACADAVPTLARTVKSAAGA
jgi:hypothetical protein